jgi:nucleoside-diphosphate-sugar epimerase
MAMPDAVQALVMLLDADPARLSTTVYNVGAFSASAQQIADRVRAAFPGADITYQIDPVRARIVDSWPEDVDDARARADWHWVSEFDMERAFDEYLIPTIRARYAAR